MFSSNSKLRNRTLFIRHGGTNQYQIIDESWMNSSVMYKQNPWQRYSSSCCNKGWCWWHYYGAYNNGSFIRDSFNSTTYNNPLYRLSIYPAQKFICPHNIHCRLLTQALDKSCIVMNVNRGMPIAFVCKMTKRDTTLTPGSNRLGRW
jgi:hypothetical protein